MLKESKLKKRFLLSYLYLVFVAVVILVVFIFLMVRLHNTILVIKSETIPITNINNELSSALTHAITLQSKYESSKSKLFLYEYNALWTYQVLPGLKDVSDFIQNYGDITVQRLFHKITLQISKLGVLHDQMHKALDLNDQGETAAQIQKKQILPLYHSITNEFIVVNRYLTDRATEEITFLNGLSYLISILMIAMILFLLAFAILLNHRNIITVVRPVRSLLKDTKSIIKGKWSGHISVKSNDEIGQLTVAFNIMRGYLRETTRKLKESNHVLQKQKEELETMAHVDLLTGLANRRYFEDILEKSIANAVRHHHKNSLLFLDLDGFKAVNDHFGHKYGDLLLIQVSKRLKQCLRTDDTLSRWGGDEFGIILSELSHEKDAFIVAEKLIAALSESFRLKEHEVFVGASIGIVNFPQPEHNSPEYLLKCADKAMYEAKQSGKGRYCLFKE